MPVTLGSNIASLRGQRQLAKTSQELGTVFQRLSSGQRINKASDDAAGLAIADSLNAQSRIFNQGIRNLNDGLSLLDVADSAIEQLSSIVIRLKELAEQAANGTYGVKQSKSIDAEAQALSKEYFRIARSTAFNGRGLFFAEFGELRLQAGTGIQGAIQSGLGGAIGTGAFGGSTLNSIGSDNAASSALGDLNGDGNLDLVTSGSTGTDGWVTVQLGNGSGSFGSVASYSMDTRSSRAVALGDLNGDGVLDLVTAGLNDAMQGSITYRLGTGSGTFGAAASFATGLNGVVDLALGDLNNDGKLDIVTSGTTTQAYATAFLGSGTGSFGAGVSYSTGNLPSLANCIALGDVNGDGVLDLVSAGYTFSSNSQITVRLGNGAGGFGALTGGPTGASTLSDLVLGDVDGDGLLDVVTGESLYGTDGYVSIYKGTAGGTFASGVFYRVNSGSVFKVALGDLNGDGFLDITAAGYDGSNGSLLTMLGTGTGTFGAAISYSAQLSVSSALSLADFNNDGVLDVASLGDGAGQQLAVRMGSSVAGVSPLLEFSLRNIASARQALSQFDRALNRLSTQRGTIGAFQSRTGVAISVLQVSSENFKAAESRIRDADIAEESSRLTRLNILQQAASSILAQANQQPALALQLLRG